MAVEQAVMADMESQSSEDVVTIELPAPQGWTKKLILEKGGSSGRNNEIVFIAPTGEEIKNKRQLSQYLKAHPGGPSNSEFDWGTGDTPRRSARLSSKPRTTETPESGSSRKRRKKSSSKNEDDKKDEDLAGQSEQGELQSNREVEMMGTEGDNTEHRKANEAPLAADNVKDSEQKSGEKAENGNSEKPQETPNAKEEVPYEIKVDDREKQEEHEESKVGAEEHKSDTHVPEEMPNAEQRQPVEHVAEAGIERADPQVPLKAPISAEIDSSKEKAMKEAMTGDGNASAEKQLGEAEAGEVDSKKNAVSEVLANVSEETPASKGVRENEEAVKHSENRPVSQDHGAPPIIC